MHLHRLLAAIDILRLAGQLSDGRTHVNRTLQTMRTWPSSNFSVDVATQMLPKGSCSSSTAVSAHACREVAAALGQADEMSASGSVQLLGRESSSQQHLLCVNRSVSSRNLRRVRCAAADGNAADDDHPAAGKGGLGATIKCAS